MKAKFFSYIGLAFILTLTGCVTHSPEQRAKITADAQTRMRQSIVKAQTDLVTSANRVPIFFDHGPEPWTHFAPPEIWDNIFVGEPSSRAKLKIVEERGKQTYENFAFTQRLYYSVTAALTVDDQVYLLTGEADAGMLLGSSKLMRELIERALLSIAKQSSVFLSSSVDGRTAPVTSRSAFKM